MTTSDLERQLAAVLHQHAEEAMNRTDTQGRLGSLLHEGEAAGRRHPGLKWAAAGLVAVATLVVVLFSLGQGTKDDGQAVAPAGTRDPVEVVRTFLDAYAAGDGLVMTSLVADGADLALGVDAAPDVPTWMRTEARWHAAVGFRMVKESCELQPGTSSETRVECTYDYHAMGSDRLRLGPFLGSTFTATVQDGRITSTRQRVPYAENGFSDQVWEPFAKWVQEAYPQDAAVMYADWPSQWLQAYTDDSIALWAKHTQDYVAQKQ